MNANMDSAEVQVVVEHLDFDVIDDHLRTSTAVLSDIMGRDDDEPSEKQQTDKRERVCGFCGKIYMSSSTLQRHTQLKHSNEESRCNHCDKTYPSLLSLEQHVRYMHRLHRCTVCYKAFNTSQCLAAHSEQCKKVETPCKFCGNMYGSAVSLKNHVKYKHPATKTHWCELCRRAFKTDKHLVNHRSTVHPVGATTCGCGKTFTSVPALHSHVLYKHTEVNARCQHCHKAFVTRSSLKRHLMKLHVNDLPVCEVKEEKVN